MSAEGRAGYQPTVLATRLAGYAELLFFGLQAIQEAVWPSGEGGYLKIRTSGISMRSYHSPDICSW